MGRIKRRNMKRTPGETPIIKLTSSPEQQGMMMMTIVAF